MKGPPTRLAEDARQPEALRSALRRSSETSPRPYDTAKGLVALRNAIGTASPSTGTGGAAGAKGALLSGGRLWWGLAAASAGAALVAGILSWNQAEVQAPDRSGRAPAASATPRGALPPPEEPAAPPSTNALPNAKPSGQAVPEPPSTRPILERPEALEGPRPFKEGRATVPPRPAGAREPATSAPGAEGPPAEDPDERLRQEIALLAEMRQALEGQPERVLSLGQAGRARFGEGMFGEERDALIIFALRHLERAAEVRERAEHFLARHPNGPFSKRVRAAQESQDDGTTLNRNPD